MKLPVMLTHPIKQIGQSAHLIEGVFKALGQDFRHSILVMLTITLILFYAYHYARWINGGNESEQTKKRFLHTWFNNPGYSITVFCGTIAAKFKSRKG